MADARLRTAVDASVSWYVQVLALHGVATHLDEGLLVTTGPLPPYHSAVVATEPGVPVPAVAAAVGDRTGLSVADCFADLDLGAVGFDPFFTAAWLHHPGVRPGGLPEGWTQVRTVDGLAAWNARHDTTRVLVPRALDVASLAVMARHEDGRLTAGCVLHRGTGAVGLSNVWADAMGGSDWAELLAVAAAAAPGRAVVGYERDDDLTGALAAGLVAVGEHRVWSRP